jgi:tetratricopeptide (TPR) repeat protein
VILLHIEPEKATFEAPSASMSPSPGKLTMRSRFLSCRRLIPVFALLLTVGASARAAEGDYVPSVKPLPSSAFIISPQDDNTFSQGTGFVVDRAARLLITNRHVVGGKEDLFVCFPLMNDGGQAYTPREYYMKKAQRIKGKVLAADTVHDLALVELAALPDEVAELPLAKKSPKVGDSARMLGNPGNSPKLWITAGGKVESVEDRKLTYKENNQKVIARISEIAVDRQEGKGASGGPVVNSAGELIGVISAGQDGKPLSVICVDVTEVRSFLVESHRNMASAAMRKKDFGKAALCCSKALRFDPTNALAYNERGAALSYLDKYGEAIADYTAAIRIEPKSARMFRNRGSAYYHQGDLDRALEDCNEAVRLDPNYAMAYLTRSKVFTKLKKPQEAEADYLRAVQIDPSLK